MGQIQKHIEPKRTKVELSKSMDIHCDLTRTCVPDLANTSAERVNCSPSQQCEEILVFVYGTLKRGFPNHNFLQNSSFMGFCQTLEQLALYADGIPIVVCGEPVSSIIGEAYLVNSQTLAALDQLEGHPNWYYRQLVDLAFQNGEKRRGWIYLFPHARSKLIQSGEFTRDLLQ